MNLRFSTSLKRRPNVFKPDPDLFLTYIAAKGKVTRSSVAWDHPLYTRGQISYLLDKFHQQRLVRRHRGKGGAFVYTYRHRR